MRSLPNPAWSVNCARAFLTPQLHPYPVFMCSCSGAVTGKPFHCVAESATGKESEQTLGLLCSQATVSFSVKPLFLSPPSV